MELYLIHDSNGELSDAIISIPSLRTDEIDVLVNTPSIVDIECKQHIIKDIGSAAIDHSGGTGPINKTDVITRLRADTLAGALIELGWF